jgi:hypothetical protein
MIAEFLIWEDAKESRRTAAVRLQIRLQNLQNEIHITATTEAILVSGYNLIF